MRFVLLASGVFLVGSLVGTACRIVTPEPPQASDGDETGGGSSGRDGSGGSGNRGGSTNRGGSANRGGSDTGGSEAGGGGGEPQGGAGSSTGGSDDGGSEAGGSSTGGSAGTGGVEECPECPTDACLADGTCVDCTADRHCENPTPRCDTTSNECVECLPSDDECSDGFFCSEAFTCVPGCKDDASCASGNCLTSNDCERCVRDAECAGGRVCSTGVCMDPCTTSCPGELTCCASHCVETDYDVSHCGGCGTTCAASQFCGTQACTANTISNVCEVSSVVVIIDAQSGDRAPAEALGAALAAQCTPAPTVVNVEQADSTSINPATGQPLSGKDLLALAGGPFGQHAIRFLDSAGATPIYPAQTASGMYEYRRSSDDTSVVTFAPSTLSSSHDYIVVQIARDALTGAPAILAYGFNQYGTAAAVWQFANVMLPNLASYEAAWYVFEWTDDGDAMPDAGDTFAALP